MSDALIGRQLGRYRVAARLGAGGMGQVYRARDERLERDVAIKILAPGLLSDDAARRRFHREARALARLSHGNIAAIYDFDSHDGTDFLVLELVEGETLDARLARGPLAEPELLRLAAQLAAGLAAAHGHEVLHCDLKPSNVGVGPGGEAKLLDFGIARALAAGPPDAQPTMTRDAGGTPGTLAYMAPEVLEGAPPDARSDLYSFGVMLYEMATGRRPFQATAPGALAHAITHDPVTPPRELRPALSPRLEEIVLRCLERDPELRYQSARDLRADLERARAGGATSARVASAPAPRHAARRPARWTRALRLAALAILAGIVLWSAAAVLHGRLFRGGHEQQIHSIAVLPMSNLSGDAEQEFFADGFTDELIVCLGRVSSLRVISRSSVMSLKGTREPLDDIARRLGVDAVIEGSILRDSGRIRVTVALVQARPERQLWGQNYERELRDVLPLQAEIARAIAGQVLAFITPGEAQAMERTRRVDPEAHDAYLRGLYHLQGLDETALEEARREFQRAIQIDPTYAAAWSGLAVAEYQRSSAFEPASVALPRARAAAERALAIDSTIAEAYATLGEIRASYDRDWPGAEAALRQAIARGPSNVWAHYYLAGVTLFEGRFAESATLFRRARELDPLNSWLENLSVMPLYFAHDYEAALESALQTVKDYPDLPDAHTWVGLCRLRLGQATGAGEELDRGAALASHTWPLAQQGYGLALLGRKTEARRILGVLEERRRDRQVPAVHLALIHLALGERDRAFALLEESSAAREEDLYTVNVDPAWDPVRADPRFRRIVEGLGLAAADGRRG